jgi:hypothetical protein
MLSILLVLSACDVTKISLGDTGGGSDDTAVDTDTDTAGDTDTAPPVETTPVTFLLGDGHTANDVAVVGVSATSYTVGATLGATAGTGDTVTVELVTPADEDLEELTDVPGMYIRLGFPVLFTDDGDLEPEGDPIEGVGSVVPIYVDGAIPAEMGALGLELGWNALYSPNDGTMPVVYPLDAVPLPANLHRRDSVTIGGVDLADPATPLRLALVSSGGGEPLLYDEALDGDWEIAVTDDPPTSHMGDISGDGLIGSVEVPVAYADADGSGTPSATEYLYPSCAGSDTAGLMYLRDEPTDVLTAASMASIGLTPGWNAFRSDAATQDITVLDEDEAATLEIGGSCSF